MYIVYTDGAVEPVNPGGHGVGGWVIKENDEILSKGVLDLGQDPTMTNNRAEYCAVYGALKDMIHRGFVGKPIMLMTDSQLVVNQLNDKWGCRAPHLRTWRDMIWKLTESFSDVSFHWIPREQNQEADEMSRSLYPREEVCPGGAHAKKKETDRRRSARS